MKTSISFLILFWSTLSFGQNVGVGTSSPSDAFHVVSKPGADPLRVQTTLANGNKATKLRIFNNGGTSLGQNNANGTPADGLYVHGNTGMGIDNPSEKLVVNGNIDIKGELKADGAAGQAGQFLTPDGSGNMVWSNVSNNEFTNVKHYPATGLYTWTVPDDVYLFHVELWGPGGQGNVGGGGGSGCYVNAYIKTTPGTNYTVTVGGYGSPYDDSKINLTSIPAIQATAHKGNDATPSAPGKPGTASISPVFHGYYILGESGQGIQKSFQQKSSTVYYEITDFGDGGAAAKNSSRSVGGHMIQNANNIGLTIAVYDGSPGGIGSGGFGFAYPTLGSNGYVIIRW